MWTSHCSVLCLLATDMNSLKRRKPKEMNPNSDSIILGTYTVLLLLIWQITHTLSLSFFFLLSSLPSFSASPLSSNIPSCTSVSASPPKQLPCFFLFQIMVTCCVLDPLLCLSHRYDATYPTLAPLSSSSSLSLSLSHLPFTLSPSPSSSNSSLLLPTSSKLYL